MISSLPNDTLTQIAQYLTARDVLRLGATCKKLSAIIRELPFWRFAYERDFGINYRVNHINLKEVNFFYLYRFHKTDLNWEPKRYTVESLVYMNMDTVFTQFFVPVFVVSLLPDPIQDKISSLVQSILKI